MKLKTLFVINAFVALISGIGFVLMPGVILPLYGIPADATDIMFARLLGGEFLSYGALTWIGINLTEKGQRAIVLGCLIGFSIGAAGLLIGQFAGVMNAFGWSLVLCYVLFSSGYGYFFFNKGEEAPQS